MQACLATAGQPPDERVDHPQPQPTRDVLGDRSPYALGVEQASQYRHATGSVIGGGVGLVERASGRRGAEPTGQFWVARGATSAAPG
jgi:hypothetical protein